MDSGVTRMGVEAPHPFPTPSPMHLILLAVAELCSFYNKPVVLSKMLSEFYELFQ